MTGEQRKLLADHIGRDAYCRLVKLHGGSCVYIPKTPHDRHPLIEEIGMEAYVRLVSWSPGASVYVPLDRRALVQQALDSGHTPREAAVAAGVSLRTAQRVAAE